MTTNTEIQKLRTELDKWRQAVANSRSTIRYLEERGDMKSKRIRELETLLNEGGTL